MYLNLLYLFINPFLSNEYTPIKNEIKKNIIYKLPENKKNIVKKINGFYGQIGPNPKYYNENYHLFDGDGMIHGIFFENGNLTYHNHWIKTDKLNFENKINFKIPISMGTIKKKEIIFLSFIYKFLELFKIVPNFMGTANTALWKNNNKIYALHERDVPYEIDINFENKNINTLKKINLKNIKYFTAHPRKDSNNIYVASYDNFLPKLKLLKYDNNLSLIKCKTINTKYNNIIHDIIVTNNYIIFCDTPYQFNITQLMNDKTPFYFDKTKKNRFCIISKDFEIIDYVDCNEYESFFIFHYDNFYEDNDNIYFTAIVRNNFDMDMLSSNSNIVNYSKYRKFIINKKTKKIIIEKKREFEYFNIEFPISNNKISVLSIIENTFDIIGFLIVKDFKLIRKNILKNRKIYAEPSIIELDKEIYIVCFTYDNDFNSYLYIYDYINNDNIEIKLGIKINKGFHSIFIKNNILF
jgi:carotenoid cleavage dioxygenase-like enzyme